TDVKLVLSNNSTDAQRKLVLNEFIETHADMNELLHLLTEPHPINMRFAWFLGDLCTNKPALLFPHLSYLFLNRKQFGILNFNRSLAKFFFHCGIPDDIEAEVLNELFVWLNSPLSDISTKCFSLKVLIQFTKKYPELENELKSNLQQLQEIETGNSFVVLINKYLNGNSF
ncbi:MAG: hypothetical protein ACOVO9_15205, partial [Bacteroidia bacterium]